MGGREQDQHNWGDEKKHPQHQNGMADDILCATLLTFAGPRWLAPSMNPYMYNHPATKRNIETIKQFGYHIIEPQNGEAVCGDLGEGKMASVNEIIHEVNKFAKTRDNSDR